MAKREQIVSDLTGKDIPSSETPHEVFVPVEDSYRKLDLSKKDFTELGKAAINVLPIEAMLPGEEEPKMLYLNPDALDALVPGERKWEDVLADAQTVKKRKMGNGAIVGVANNERDYTSVDWAGSPKKGTTSEYEKRTIFNNFVQINRNLLDREQRLVDPRNPQIAERYGLGKHADDLLKQIADSEDDELKKAFGL
jgi:hypothetical protein